MNFSRVACEQQYQTIMSTNFNYDLLLVEEIETKKTLKRVSLLNIFSRFLIFGEDWEKCSVDRVSHTIADLAFQPLITQKQRTGLKSKLEELESIHHCPKKKNLVHRQVERVEEAIRQAKQIPFRLRKNRQAALSQQTEERPLGFQLDLQRPNPCDQTGINLKFKKIPPVAFSLEMRTDAYDFATAATRGMRATMEDRSMASILEWTCNSQLQRSSVFGVFDGHGGDTASEFAQNHFPSALRENLELCVNLDDASIYKALKACFKQLHGDLPDSRSGTTATIAVVINEKLWIASVGDSRALIVTEEGAVIQATEDARPNIPRYRDAIAKRGGEIFRNPSDPSGPPRLGGIVAMATAIGDKSIPGISPNPKITAYDLKKIAGGLLLLATDGLFEVAATTEAGRELYKMKARDMKLSEMCTRMVEGALLKGSTDNTTVLLVSLS